MAPGYVFSCEQYSKMANNSYRQYLTAKVEYDSMQHDSIDIFEEYAKWETVLNQFNLMYENAISSILFESLAIESFINLLGVHLLGEEEFFTNYEPEKSKKPKNFRYLSSIDKLKKICIDYFDKYISCDVATRLDALFKKRDRLVHPKPHQHIIEVKKEYCYDDPQESYADIIPFFEEIGFVFEDIDSQMKLYDEIKDNIKELRQTETDIIEEITTALKIEIYNIISNM